tara:strand:+ start:442 stop:591 length:150 start_codon:yes stop_codon:yes gene_type:complete
MHPFTREFIQLTKLNEYSDLLEDTDWAIRNLKYVISPLYSDLLEDTEWA